MLELIWTCASILNHRCLANSLWDEDSDRVKEKYYNRRKGSCGVWEGVKVGLFPSPTPLTTNNSFKFIIIILHNKQPI